uniref:Cyclin-like F-box n=1 Tax=Medicago truncatula TaxID=3880 RepID=A4PU43_MEDTR|nr:Cyclin-like F-box [Medicago truncatula]
MMANIPSELLTDILSMLPVESLLRFRSTSKSLRSPSFTSKTSSTSASSSVTAQISTNSMISIT